MAAGVGHFPRVLSIFLKQTFTMFADGIEKTVYRKLSEEDSVEDISTRLPNRRNRRDTICQCIPWVLLAIVSILYASHWYLQLRHDGKSPCFDGS
jgi:hypothetical protein